MDDGRPPKKAYAKSKTATKPPKEKIMVKRNIISTETDILRHQRFRKLGKREAIVASESEVFGMSVKGMRKLMFAEEEPQPAKTRRSGNSRRARIPAGQSPLAVTDAANYNEAENKYWVKPLFSSIVYRLPVSNSSNI